MTENHKIFLFNSINVKLFADNTINSSVSANKKLIKLAQSKIDKITGLQSIIAETEKGFKKFRSVKSVNNSIRKPLNDTNFAIEYELRIIESIKDAATELKSSNIADRIKYNFWLFFLNVADSSCFLVKRDLGVLKRNIDQELDPDIDFYKDSFIKKLYEIIGKHYTLFSLLYEYSHLLPLSNSKEVLINITTILKDLYNDEDFLIIKDSITYDDWKQRILNFFSFIKNNDTIKNIFNECNHIKIKEDNQSEKKSIEIKISNVVQLDEVIILIRLNHVKIYNNLHIDLSTVGIPGKDKPLTNDHTDTGGLDL